ncbi:hypothetical protein B0A50_01428 [Salinomyces thailandicus]|uniref:Ubiquitination network signaling protein n=1 Tax=Salinomyces thailandicus TaxID=706561 RepID=A0A4U0U9Y9_9PEZI|nr:hypothetical protein B0A50_01428 [Salinomyces thailandica]
MPPKKSTKNAPNTRDTRHENGLAAPGKRISKKGSNGQLNGQTNGKPAASVTPPALPSTGLNQGLRFPRPPDTTKAAETGLQPAAKDDEVATEGKRRDRTASETSMEDASLGAEMGDTMSEPAVSAAQSVETPPAACSKPGISHAPGTLSAVSTILTYYPLRDAISILILLLSLPPTLVLVIQTLFASLTFVPPTAGISLSTLPNFKEMFNASNLGYPALATILIVDLLFWVCWLPVWKPVQSILLDLSQAVVAVSLSGAAASSGGPTYSIASCTLIVFVVHVLRYKAIHLTALDYLRSVIHKMNIGIQLDVSPFASSFLSPTPPTDRGWIFTVVRTALGIHILSQGITTCIRRSLVKANERDQTVPAITKTDPEAAAGSEPNSRTPTGVSDGPQSPHAASSIDGRPPGLSPSQREGSKRESSSKKKKKQANQVRSQQPLWAAIASTKVTFVKEMEQRDAADDAREAAAMDTNTRPTFASTLNPNTNRIWISEVRDTDIFFCVDLSAEAAAETAENMEDGTNVSASLDKSKPFYVRVNGAAWSSTRIMSSATGEGADGKSRYDGEIFGLAPLSSYHCETVGIATGNVLCSVSLITQAAPSAEQATSVLAQQQHPALRPSSPTTTLKQSLQSAEAKLNETRNRTRKSKKDQRGVHSDIRKEINMLRSKLESTGGFDEKQERRLAQISQHKNQAEEASAELKNQIEAFGDISGDEIAESDAKLRVWHAAKDAKRAAEKDYDDAKAEVDREVSALKAEIVAAEARREKLASRHAQRAKDLETLQSRQQAEMSARQKRDLERAQLAQQRREAENDSHNLIAKTEDEAASFQAKAQDAYQQIALLQSWNTGPSAFPSYSSPPTPEGVLPGTTDALSPQANGFSSYGPQAFQSPMHSSHPSTSHSQPQPVQRGRSSSMLSQYSGFTDDGNDIPYIFPQPEPRQQYPWPMQPVATAGAAMHDDRMGSDGGGSGSLTNGSTGSNSPRPDAKPFVPAGKLKAPIGPPSKSREKVPQSPGAVGSGR